MHACALSALGETLQYLGWMANHGLAVSSRHLIACSGIDGSGRLKSPRSVGRIHHMSDLVWPEGALQKSRKPSEIIRSHDVFSLENKHIRQHVMWGWPAFAVRSRRGFLLLGDGCWLPTMEEEYKEKESERWRGKTTEKQQELNKQ